MIVRYSLQPVFHLADARVATYCGRVISPSAYWKRRHRFVSVTVGDENGATMWGYICGACMRVVRRKGTSQYDDFPVAPQDKCSERMRATSIVDMANQCDMVKAI
jgi:hypothetical protein